MIIHKSIESTKRNTPFTLLELEEREENLEKYLKEAEKYILMPSNLRKNEYKSTRLIAGCVLCYDPIIFPNERVIVPLVMGGVVSRDSEIFIISTYFVFGMTEKEIEDFEKIKKEYKTKIKRNGSWTVIYYAPITDSLQVFEDLEKVLNSLLSDL